jgi:Fe2+ transport protein
MVFYLKLRTIIKVTMKTNHNPKQIFLSATLFCLGLGGCQVSALLTEVPSFEGTIFLQKERLVSGGAITVSLALTSPELGLSFPSEILPGGNEEPGELADLHLSMTPLYTAAGVLGANKKNDFVPYLIVSAAIENLDDGARLDVLLVPEVSLLEGYHYGRNLRLIDSVGASEAGYKITLRIIPPALLGDASAIAPEASLSEQQQGASPLSPGIMLEPTLAPFLLGTVFTTAPIGGRQAAITTITGAFTLNDFIAAEEEGSEGLGSGELPVYSY